VGNAKTLHCFLAPPQLLHSLPGSNHHSDPPPGKFRTFPTTKLVGIWLWIDFRRLEPNILRFHPHLQRFEIRPTCSSSPFG